MKKYILVLAAFFTVGISGCKKNYLDLETNPNTPSTTTPQLTLSAALTTTASIIVNDYTEYGVWDGYWTTSGNYVPNQSINQYQFTNTSFSSDWTDWYLNLTNYNNIYNLSVGNASLSNFQAIAMIMKAYGFSHLVDEFNDVPYTQAFTASKTLTPVYDKGSDIYADLFKQLDAAIALINKNIAANTSGTVIQNQSVPGTSDFVFGTANSINEMIDWIRFANSLKLRLAMRVSSPGVPGSFNPTTIMATTANIKIAGYSGSNFLDGTTYATVNPGYANLAGKQNPFWATYGSDASGNQTFGGIYYVANAVAVNTLAKFNDPRLTSFYTQVPTSGTDATLRVRGNIFGDTHATLLSDTYTSEIGPGLLKSPSQNAIIFSGAESLFLQAEATQDGILTGSTTAQTFYEAGITASFEQLGLTDAQAQAYYTQSPAIANVNWSASTPETAIITQKWLSLNSYFNFEAWNEFRRTNIPALPSSIDPAAINPTLPTRLPYPLSELTTNGGNLAKEGTINPFTSHIFWDVRTTIN